MIEMKRDSDDRAVAERMAPGALSREGFLGSDQRPLADIIRADRAEAERLGVTCELLAERLRRILDAAVAALGAPVQVAPHLTTVHREAMGRIPCPVSGCGLFPKGEAEVTDTATGERILLSPLSVHLLREHGFCQGRGSRYRLEPAALIRLLGLG